MEHLNRRLKEVINPMGANVRPSTIAKAGKALKTIVSSSMKHLTMGGLSSYS